MWLLGDRRDDEWPRDGEASHEESELGRDLNAEVEGEPAQEGLQPGEPGGFPGGDLARDELGGDGGWIEPPPERRPPKTATYVAFAIVIMAVLGVLMTIAAVQLFLQQRDVLDTLEQSVERLSVVYAGPSASDVAKRRVAWLERALDERDFAQAQQALQALGSPEAGQPALPSHRRGATASPGGHGTGDDDLPDPHKAQDLPSHAQDFFAEHAELWKDFLGFTQALIQMDRADIPAEDLEELRGLMVESARLGNAGRVQRLLEQAKRRIEAMSGENVPDSLKEKLNAFGAALQAARREHRDVQRAVQFAQRSEEAAKRGQYERAERLMDRAVEALRNAPRRRLPRAPQRPGRMPPMGPEIGFYRFLADLAGKVMRVEERDLTRVWESINIAAGAIREKNADQVCEILDRAKEAMHSIGERRRAMSRTIQEAQEKLRSARPAREAREEQQQRTAVVLSRITGILEQVRGMSDEEFAASRRDVAGQLLAALTAPVHAQPEQAPEMTPEQRVRAKMRLAQEIYITLRDETGLETADLERHFEQARDLIAERKYEEAEALVDEEQEIMRRMLREAEGRPLKPAEGEATVPIGGDLNLDLRGIGVDEPIMAPPPALEDEQDVPLDIAPLTTTDEEAE